jgi:hypothetical protein
MNSRRAPRAIERRISKEKWEGPAWTPIRDFVVSLRFVSLNMSGDSFSAAWFFSVFELTYYLDRAGNQKIQDFGMPPRRTRTNRGTDLALR